MLSFSMYVARKSNIPKVALFDVPVVWEKRSFCEFAVRFTLLFATNSIHGDKAQKKIVAQTRAWTHTRWDGLLCQL